MSSAPPPLRPMSAGDILDQAVRIYRQNFVPLVIIVAIISVPLLLIQVAASLVIFPLTEDPSLLQTSNLGFVALLFPLASGLATFVGWIANIFRNGALAWFVSERYLDRKVTVRQAYARAFGRWLSLLIAAILLGLVYLALFGIYFGVFTFPFLGAAALGSGDQAAAAAALGLVSLCSCFLILPAVSAFFFLSTRWLFHQQAIVIENYNSTGGLGRSWKLVKGTFWRVLLFNLVLSVLVWALSIGPILLAYLLAFLLPSPLLQSVIGSIASTVILILFTPIQFAALTILYYDLRIRKEGFDLQWQLQEASHGTTASELPSLLPGASA